MRFLWITCLLFCACAPKLPAPTAQEQIETGHALIAEGQYEMALRAFNRAALALGATDAEILSGMGTANLELGRLGQAEEMYRIAIAKEGDWPELWNNLGVVLMEKGEPGAAAAAFRRAVRLDRGESAAIAQNLELALSKTETPVYGVSAEQDYKLVRRGRAEYLIRKTAP